MSKRCYNVFFLYLLNRYNHENGAKPENAKFPIYYYEEFLEVGNDIEDSVIYDSIKQQKPNDCCALIFTSGTVV